MKKSIDDLVGCLGTQSADQCSNAVAVATIETSRYVDIVDAKHFTSDRSILAAVPLFVEVFSLLTRLNAAGSHRRFGANVRTLTVRRTTNDQGLVSKDSVMEDVMLRLKDLRLPAWSEL
jgi:hypothetical protein